MGGPSNNGWRHAWHLNTTRKCFRGVIKKNCRSVEWVECQRL